VEKATSKLPAVEDPACDGAPEEFPTPGVRSIEDLVGFEGGAPAERQIKTLVYVVDGTTVLVLLRGDHELAVQKLMDAIAATEVRAASEAEIRAALGAGAGSLGAVGVSGLKILADAALQGRSAMTTGANRDDHHLRHVDVARDIAVDHWLDLREVGAGEACPLCETPLGVRKSIEVGHIFKLGTKYADALDATVLDDGGASHPIVMGSYGIGIGRAMAAVAEVHHDDNGLIWPVSVAPYEVVVTVVNPNDVETIEAASRIYDALREAGVEALLDDRDERPGVKFKDADLVGIPYRITVGPKGLKDGKVDFQRRRDGERRDLDVHKAAGWASETILEERR
jgi:prolyl-tRNA synthetase